MFSGFPALSICNPTVLHNFSLHSSPVPEPSGLGPKGCLCLPAASRTMLQWASSHVPETKHFCTACASRVPYGLQNLAEAQKTTRNNITAGGKNIKSRGTWAPCSHRSPEWWRNITYGWIRSVKVPKYQSIVSGSLASNHQNEKKSHVRKQHKVQFF